MKKQIELLALLVIFSLSRCQSGSDGIIMTVTGPVPARSAGITLTHEHILVDFIGTTKIMDFHMTFNKDIFTFYSRLS